MKICKFSFTLVSISVLAGLMFIASCKPDEPTRREKTLKLLTSATWKISSVTVDGTDETSFYAGMTLKFDARTYTPTNGRVVWPQQDTWAFKDNTFRLLTRGDEVDVSIVSLDKNALVLSLEWPERTLGTGRVISKRGTHQFSFTK